MSRQRRMKRVLALCAGLAIIASACGNGDDQVETATGEDEATPEATPAEEGAAQEEEDAESDESPFYEGQTITLMVPFGEGGGTDTAARQLVGPLSDHIPGNPSIQVQNVPGGDSILGANEFAASDPDGLTILMTSASTAFHYIFEDPAVEFDFADFRAVAGLPAGAVQYVSADTGVSTPEEAYNVTEPFIYGGVQPSGGELSRLMGLSALEIDYEPIFGYEGRGQIRVAFEQGETTLDGSTSQAYLEHIVPLVESGDAIPLYTNGMTQGGQLIRDPAFPDLPHAGELYEQQFGQAPSGELWDAYTYLITLGNTLQKPVWIHGDAPQQAIDEIEEGFASLAASDQYAEELLDALGYELILGADLQDQAQDLVNFDRDLVQFMREWVLEEFGQEI